MRADLNTVLHRCDRELGVESRNKILFRRYCEPGTRDSASVEVDADGFKTVFIIHWYDWSVVHSLLGALNQMVRCYPYHAPIGGTLVECDSCDSENDKRRRLFSAVEEEYGAEHRNVALVVDGLSAASK